MTDWNPKYSPRVASWLSLVEEEAPGYAPDVVLALIHVESAGDEYAKRPGSQFHGLLQMGRMAGVDVGFQDRAHKTTAVLHGNGRLAIRMWARYQDRYSERTRGDIRRQALCWKGGPGYVARVNKLTDAGEDFDVAVEMVGKALGFSATEYMQRFDLAFDIWSERVCTPGDADAKHH